MTHLLVHIQLAENLGRIQQVLVVVDPKDTKKIDVSLTDAIADQGREGTRAKRGRDVLLRIEGEERQVQDDRKPVAVDHKQEGQESVDSGFGDDVGVEAVAEVDGVDVVTVPGGVKVSWLSVAKEHPQATA